MRYTLLEVARRIGAELEGDPAREVRGVATLETAGPDELSFLTHPRYRDAARTTKAGAVLLGPGETLGGRALLVSREPYLALARALTLFHPRADPPPGVSPDARIADDVELGHEVSIGAFTVVEAGCRLGDRVRIGSGCSVGAGSTIGDDSELCPRVVLYPRTRVGSRCLLHAGVVLGADGFGFASDASGHHKVPQVGRVVVEDDVEIGANSTVDRAMLGETVIGAGSKLDDQVMVAHGVRLGERALLAAQSGIAGSTRTGRGLTLAGQSGIAGHLHLGEGAIVAAKSAVFSDQPERAFVAGIPATDHRKWKRSQAGLARLSAALRELRRLREKVAALEGGRGEDSKT